MKDALEEGVKVVSAPQLFPTPPELARQVYDSADIQPESHVLEPSAGTAALIDGFRALPTLGRLVMVEINYALAASLRDRFPNAAIVCADFLECVADVPLAPVSLPLGTRVFGRFDRIVMNPPFANAADIQHIRHALTFLKPGGRLVAICANGPRQREALQPLAAQWIDLPEGSFAESGTNVNAAIVVIDA